MEQRVRYTQCGKTRNLPSPKKFREFNIALEETLFSRNFCLKSVKVNFCKLHTVTQNDIIFFCHIYMRNQFGWFWKGQKLMFRKIAQKFIEFQKSNALKFLTDSFDFLTLQKLISRKIWVCTSSQLESKILFSSFRKLPTYFSKGVAI